MCRIRLLSLLIMTALIASLVWHTNITPADAKQYSYDKQTMNQSNKTETRLGNSSMLAVKAINLSSSIVIDGIVQTGEWDNTYGYTIEKTLGGKEYRITLHSTNDTRNLYLLAAVKGLGASNFTGNGTFIVLFNSNQSGRLDQGDDAIMIYNGIHGTNKNDSLFFDLFWDTYNETLQKDYNYGGTNDGTVGISFSNGTEYFELSHPLCSADDLHDFCITPTTMLGASLTLGEKGNLPLNLKKTPFSYFTAQFGMGDKCSASGAGACEQSPATSIVPSAAFIFEALERINATKPDSEHFLELITIPGYIKFKREPPTSENLHNFLSKLDSSNLEQLLNVMTPQELKYLSNTLAHDELKNILSKLPKGEYDKISKEMQLNS